MQIVIEIDEELYNYIQTEKYDKHLDARFDYQVRFAVRNGTPLPKGHGDLVDTSYFEHYLRDTYIDSVSFKRATSAMKRLSTIIEADKGSEDKE